MPLMAIANKLILKSLHAKSNQALKFVILNDTIHLIHYDQAVLLKVNKNKVTLEGISGQKEHTKNTYVDEKWTRFRNAINSSDKIQELRGRDFQDNQELLESLHLSKEGVMAWLPIPVKNGPDYALLLQKYSAPEKEYLGGEVIDVLDHFVIPGYGVALGKKTSGNKFVDLIHSFQFKVAAGMAVFFASLFLIHLPLRIIAPCEIVPEDPTVMTAPLDGIIAEVLVRPGQKVEKGTVLYEYDKRVPLQQLKVAEKEVAIVNSEIDRAFALTLEHDPKAINELAVLTLKLEKEKIKYDLARSLARQLTIDSPIEGVVVIDDPSQWRGRPVSVGEKVLSVTDPKKTMVRLWIPERDNIHFNPDIPLKVILNVNPDNSYTADLAFVANESMINKEKLPSFVAEAKWKEQPKNVKIGLEGTAVLYGENVTLFYFLARKPWSYLRNLLNI